MPSSRPVALFCILALAAAPARAQSSGPDADAVKAGVIQVLSLATFGLIPVQDLQAAVTQDGPDYRMRLPLTGLAAPTDAAITAVARPLRYGKVDIESMAFPSNGTLQTTVATGAANRIEYSVGKQVISAMVDPTLATESTYTAEFGDVRLVTAQGEQHGEQTIDHLATDGTFSAGPDGRLTFVTQSQATGFHLVGHGPNGFMSDTSVRAMAGHFSVENLDRAQGTRMLAALRGLMAADAQARAQRAEAPPGQVPAGEVPPAPGATPEQRRQLGAVVDAAGGLLSRVEVDETMEDVHFAVGGARGNGAGTISSVRLTMAGDAAQERLNTRLGIVADGIAVPGAAAGTVELIPHHVDLKTVLAGVPVAKLMALLRAAPEDHADPVLLQAQARALFADPQARVEIETLSFDAGPLAVTGSAKLRPRANGDFGGDIHIAARGVDALLAQVQGQPKLQQAMPLIFLAKGMGRAQGDSLVWDIVVGDGPLTINGTPFGQPAGKTR
jgi:hypothetical protein